MKPETKKYIRDTIEEYITYNDHLAMNEARRDAMYKALSTHKHKKHFSINEEDLVCDKCGKTLINDDIFHELLYESKLVQAEGRVALVHYPHEGEDYQIEVVGTQFALAIYSYDDAVRMAKRMANAINCTFELADEVEYQWVNLETKKYSSTGFHRFCTQGKQTPQVSYRDSRKFLDLDTSGKLVNMSDFGPILALKIETDSFFDINSNNFTLEDLAKVPQNF